MGCPPREVGRTALVAVLAAVVSRTVAPAPAHGAVQARNLIPGVELPLAVVQPAGEGDPRRPSFANLPAP